jgi:O-antigen ligase
MFFFEKKNQKTFAIWAEPTREGRSQKEQKFFASFFQKSSPFFLAFLAACFALPTEAAFSLVFYVTVLPVAWSKSGRAASSPAEWLAFALIVWSGLTLLWGEGDSRRTMAFALATACTLVFFLAQRAVLADASSRRQVATLLVWAGAANAVWSIGRGIVLHSIAPQLLGWGVTHHPILGASVMSVCMLTALIRVASEARLRWVNTAAFTVMAAFILLTESRGPLLAASLGTLVIGLGGPWRRRTGFCIMTLCILLMREPLAWRQHQIGILTARGMHQRPEIWLRTLALIRERPLFGHGLAANLDLPGVTFPHDLALGVLFYSGAIGFALFAALIIGVTRLLFRIVPLADRVWLAGLWVSALVSGLTDLGQITKGPGALWLIFWLPAGLILAYPTRIRPAPCSASQATA